MQFCSDVEFRICWSPARRETEVTKCNFAGIAKIVKIGQISQSSEGWGVMPLLYSGSGRYSGGNYDIYCAT